MTHGSKLVGEDDLVAYVDGELPPERKALVEAWLADHPEAASRVAEDRRTAARLRAALVGVAEGPLPTRLRVDSIRRRKRHKRMARARLAAAAVLLLAVGVGAGWTLHSVTTVVSSPEADIAAALAAHRIFVAEKAHPVEVAADAHDHLGVWLGNRLGRRVEIPDLRAVGLTLMGGRLLPGPSGPAGQLMYQTADGHRVTLFLQPGSGAARSFFFAEYEGDDALAWRSPELSYVLTGPLSRDRLTEIAHEIHSAPAS